MATERVGHAVALRLHGVAVRVPLSLEFEVVSATGNINLQYEISHEPTLLPPRFDVGRYAVAGGNVAWPVAAAPKAGAVAPSHAWAVAIASQEVQVPDEISNAFRDGPDAGAESVLACISPDERFAVRSTADRSVALLTDYFHAARPELWSTTAVVWRNANYFVAVGHTDAARIVEPAEVGEEWLQEFGRRAAGVLRASEKQRRIVGVAFNWLLSSHSQPHGSNECFICCFNCIEVLLSLDEAQIASSDAEQLEEIGRILRASDDHARDSLLAFVNRLKGRSGRAPLTARFAALAKHLCPEHEHEDVESMRIISKARNQLVHGAVARAEDAVPGEDVHGRADDLAIRYATSLVARLAVYAEPPVYRRREMAERRGEA